MDLKLRDARVDEAEELTTIAHDAKRFWGYPDAWLVAWRSALTITEEDLHAWTVRVAEVEGRIVGFSALRATAREAMELEHLWVRPGWMGKGIGRVLVRDCQEQAAAQGARSIWLDADPNAEGFYRHIGAFRAGVTESVVLGKRRELPRMRLPVQVVSWLHGTSPADA